MNIRPLADNVVVRMEDPPKETASGIHIVHNRKAGAREHRTAVVLAVGPGHYDGCKACGGVRSHFTPTTVKVGDRVVLDAMAGQNYDLDVSVTRRNLAPQFQELLGERGEFRIVREGEIHAVLEDEAVRVAAE